MDRGKAIQISIFSVIFVAALFLWNYFLVGKNNQGVTETAQASLPILTIKTDEEKINQLHGYTGNIDASTLRDSITPLSGDPFKVVITDGESEAVSYKLYDTDNQTVLDKGEAAFKKIKKEDAAEIEIEERMDSGKTYLM
mgnify:CR=1 FL=1